MGIWRSTIAVTCIGTMLLVAVLNALAWSDALMLVPALVAFWPLLCHRYVGEARLARLVAQLHGRPPRRQRSVPALRSARPCAIRIPRGGRLLGVSLAVRPPPAVLASS